MTAKEKAKELYDKFDNLYCNTCEEYPELEMCSLCHHQVKQCALICVEEIMPNIDDHSYELWGYWTDVKQEINKL